MGSYFYQIKKRCQNRQIHKANFLKGGNQAPYIVKGFRLFDKVNRIIFLEEEVQEHLI